MISDSVINSPEVGVIKENKSKYGNEVVIPERRYDEI